jgi:hypothetical protein
MSWGGRAANRSFYGHAERLPVQVVMLSDRMLVTAGPCATAAAKFTDRSPTTFCIDSKSWLLQSSRRKGLRPPMRTLADRITRELRESALPIPYCAIYEEELQQYWPLQIEDRQHQIETFAKEYGFKLRFYRRGLCAIFQEQPPRK